MCAVRLHLPGRSWTRRDVLSTALGAAVAWPFLGSPRSEAVTQTVRTGDYPFSLGVASGDPLPDGFVIWTRLAPKPLEGGGMPPENVQVKWTVAHDEAMTKVAAQGTAVATPELAHAVHVEVPGLDPARWYYYRFEASGEASPVGRARTAPRFDEMPARARFAFASCQSFEQGFYTAYHHMAREDLDLVFHLGDYIYEYEARPKALRPHVGPLLRELGDYRNRHAQYKTDPLLQAAHAACPWVVTWDDHELANNCNISHSARGTGETPDMFHRRRAAAYKAYYEHMPLRATQIPKGPDMQLYRHLKYGRLAEFAVLDTRQYRTPQPCGDGNRAPCPEALSPTATLTGDAQERWLFDNLRRSSGVWNVLAQQVMMARVDRQPGPDALYSMDQWPGYEANRRRVLKFFAENPKLNPIVLAGDIHCNWANQLQIDSADEKSPVVGAEFVGTSISSGGDGAEQRGSTPKTLSENPFVKFFNDERGYGSCELTPTSFTTHYRTVPYVTRPDAPLNTRKSFTVEAGKPGLQV